jgi:hypothetical protein
MLKYWLERYDRSSLVAFTLLIAVAALIGYRFSDLIATDGGMDWLLAATWVAMAALLSWDVDPRRDLLLLAVGFGGGFVIEWWGTNTQLWSYFTDQRPPPWILPAWPIAALSIERIKRLLDRFLSTRSFAPPSDATFRSIYWCVIPAFNLALLVFIRPSMGLLASWVVSALVLTVSLRCPEPRRDVLLFAAGSLLGIFLEYWGTSRECWTYYNGQVPPPAAVFAHGFASVAFARGYNLVERVLSLVFPLATPATERQA